MKPLRRRGMSLLETVFATLILGFVVMAVAELFPGSTLALHRADAEIQAGTIAQAALDKWRSCGWSRDTPLPGTGDLTSSEQGADVNSPDFVGETACGVYERDRLDDWDEIRDGQTYHVVVTFDRPANYKVHVTATVTWSLRGQNHSLIRKTTCVQTLNM